MKPDLIAAVRTASDKPYLSERECLAIVRGVLGVVREPGDALCVAGKFAANADAGIDEHANSTMIAHAFTAMIDALLGEVGE